MLTRLIFLLLALAPLARTAELFDRENLVAWCIVPFDAKKRGPAERAEMVKQLGIPAIAYDWRAEHVPQFEQEILEYQKRGLRYFAFWGQHDEADRLFAKHGLHPQFWMMIPKPSAEAQDERVKEAAAKLLPAVQRAAKLGSQVALYNHGGWSGEPENMVSVCRELREKHGAANVGIVYNLHHGHDHVDRFAQALAEMKPYLLCLNLNGMTRDGEKLGKKILPLGQGELDLGLLKIIRDSGYRGPIGILGHTQNDAEEQLRDNLDGLDWLVPQLDGKPAGPKPKPRTMKIASAEPGKVLTSGVVIDGKPEYRVRPITVECRVKLNSAARYNIFVASDTKASAEHWELYSQAGTGEFAVFQPGRGGVVKSSVNVCDGQWHTLSAVIEPERVKLHVDGKLVKEAPALPLKGEPKPGGLAIARLVEGTLGCDGEVTDVRLSRDGRTLLEWKPAAPVASPPAEAHIIPAAKPNGLTRANGWPAADSFRSWTRSLGGPTSNRFTALTQITKQNVAKLVPAWTYHSGAKGNVQCNPIVVDGTMFAPTAGGHLVALDAATGKEKWRYLPQPKGKRLEDAVARRGLLYWGGDAQHPARVIFGVGNWVCALAPKTGQPLATFGKDGRAELPTGATAVGAVYRHVLVIPGYLGDAFGYDVRTGERLWTFETKDPATWSRLEQGANCWGGMALDESRGIAFIGLGSPKPNFFGMGHLGDNLYSNCVLALDALTGKRLWHFQEIRHDIWDWDIPAPPNLVTVERHGVKVDAVAQVTKMGNTLLLDRVTGQPLYDFPLRRVATRVLPGDVPAPLQPFIELPQPFSRSAFTMADVTQRTPEANVAAMLVAQRANMGPYPSLEEAKPTLMFNIHGGAEWTGAAADPRGRLYVTANEIPWFITCFRDDDPEPAKPPTAGEQAYMSVCVACHGPDRRGIGHAPPLRGLRHRLNDEQIMEQMKNGRGSMPPMLPLLQPEQVKPLLDFLLCRDRPIPPVDPNAPVKWTFGGWNRLVDPDGYPGCTPPWGTLTCLDLNTGKIAWQVPFGEYDELKAKGVPKTGQENFGGCTVTASGLVIAGGTRDKKLRAFDADTGAELWSYQLPLHSTAPPASYEVNGRQFIVVPVTGGGKLGGETSDMWMAFALPVK